MERRWRRWIGLMDWLVIAFVASSAAYAAANALMWPCHLPRLSWLVQDDVESDQPSPTKSIDAILRRNIFCSGCGGYVPAVTARPDVAPLTLPLTTLPLRLLAVMYAERPEESRWSVAVVRDDDSGTVKPVGVGSAIRAATVDRIDATRIYLDLGAGRRELLDLLAPAPARSAGRNAPAARAAGADRDTLSFRDGIRRTGERRYEVQRRTLDAWLGNLRQLAQQVRIYPENDHGRPAGVRLSGIQPAGPLAAIGLEDGDIIAAINGLELDSPDQALAAYVKLRNVSHISIAIDRRGRRLNLDYDIRQ